MRSSVFVRNLRIPCRIGVSEEERIRRTELVVDVELGVDVERAAASDSIEDAVDYRRVREVLLDVAASREFRLVESFAVEGARALASIGGVVSLRIRVEKPGVPAGAAGAGVEIEMEMGVDEKK
ncbi:MAG: dihydroneopterin aldolase [Conexivisphaera sp.]